MRVTHHRLAPVAAVCLAAALAGCGGSGAAANARDVAVRFERALAAGKGTAACALLDAGARRAVTQQEGAPCPRAILRAHLPHGRVTGTQAAITNAKVDLAGGESAFLGQTGAGWRLSAIGCRPVGGKPQDRPYDCEIAP